MLVQDEKRFHCVGCGAPIPWNGKDMIAYTCTCRGTLFADEKGNLAPPASLVMAIANKTEFSHIDYYLGISSYVSAEKNKVFEYLSNRGAIWTWNCKKCKKDFLNRLKEEVRFRLVKFELHPQLKELLK